MRSNVESELKKVVYLCMLVSMTVFSVFIIILNRLLGWEIWMIPIILVGTFISWRVYIANQMPQKAQLYVCAAFSMIFVFYYSVKINTVYDCGIVMVIMLLLFAFTREKVLTWTGIVCSIFSLLFHLLVKKLQGGLTFDLPEIVRTVSVFLMVPFAAVLIDHIVKAWSTAEQNYLNHINELTDENERVNNFLANVSHEVRTPISAVIGLSHVLLKDDLPKQAQGKIQAISQAGHRVSEQINDILDFTEIDMGKMAVTNDNYMICSMINDLLTQLSLADNYGLDLVVDIESDIPAVLMGDEIKIKRILWHLIRNGFKYTKEGGVCLRIYSKKRDYGINLILEVKDTGIGISEEEMESIYEKFYQVDSGRARNSSGLGLGIPIVNGLTKAVGGIFNIESKTGEGTLVRVSIPQKVIDGRPAISVVNSRNCVVAGFLGFMTTGHPRIREFYMEMIGHMSSGLSIPFYRVQSRQELEMLVGSTGLTHLFVGTGEYLENRDYIDELSKKMNVALVADQGFEGDVIDGITILPKPFYGTQIANFLGQVFSRDKVEDELSVIFPGLRTLVVDDEHMNLIVAREIFEGYGMEITTAGSGEESIRLCERNEYDLVFMDHMMPGMDGVEAMHRIRQIANRQRKDVLIVALTANAISSARDMFISEGFDGFIPKPIEVTEVERVLKKILPESKIAYTTDPKRRSRFVKKQEISEAADAEAAGNKIETDVLERIKALGVDIDSGLEYCNGDREFYEELLSDYADIPEQKLKDLADYYEKKDLRSYEVRVHAIKSTSKLLGALDVSEQARLLEEAAKNGNEEEINKRHSGFICDYEKLMRAIRGEQYLPPEGGAL